MIITSEDILKEVKFPNGLDEFQVNPHSIDLRVSEDVTMKVGDHILARTMDIVELPDNIMAVVFPRSSLNRMNVTLDITGVVDAGYSGSLVLPMTAHKDIFIKKGTRIASLIFYRLEKQVKVRLSKYQNSDGSYKPDKTVESDLVEGGNIEELKTKFHVVI